VTDDFDDMLQRCWDNGLDKVSYSLYLSTVTCQ